LSSAFVAERVIFGNESFNTKSAQVKHMDLAKIIVELRTELQCLDTAIASIEELARVQNIAEAHIRPVTEEAGPTPPKPGPDNSPPMKRRRGRPRKSEVQGNQPKPISAGSSEPGEEPSASAA
jgi:hypothetical protein